MGARSTFAPNKEGSAFDVINLSVAPMIDGNEFKDHPTNLFRDGLWNTDKEVIVGNGNAELYVFDIIIVLA